jgi:hypothetical protein
MHRLSSLPLPPAVDGFISAAQMVAGIQRLHAKLRSSVDLMGIGLAAPRSDTVAEDGAAAAPAGKDVGDVRWGAWAASGQASWSIRLGCAACSSFWHISEKWDPHLSAD